MSPSSLKEEKTILPIYSFILFIVSLSNIMVLKIDLQIIVSESDS